MCNCILSKNAHTLIKKYFIAKKTLTIIWDFSKSQYQITDHHKNLIIIRKVWKVRSITSMWHQDMKWANAPGKMTRMHLLSARSPPTFNLSETIFVKSNEDRCDKTWFGCICEGSLNAVVFEHAYDLRLKWQEKEHQQKGWVWPSVTFVWKKEF